MTPFSYLYAVVPLVLAIGIVVAVLLTAPNLATATNRIRLGLTLVTRTVAIAGFVLFVVMLAWGLYTRDETLTYFSLMPLALALLTSNFMRRSGL